MFCVCVCVCVCVVHVLCVWCACGVVWCGVVWCGVCVSVNENVIRGILGILVFLNWCSLSVTVAIIMWYISVPYCCDHNMVHNALAVSNSELMTVAQLRRLVQRSLVGSYPPPA